MDIDLAPSVSKYLFKDIEELANTLHFYPETEGYCISPIAVLAWEGLSLKEILSIKNEEISFDKSSVTISTGNETLTITSGQECKILINFSKTGSVSRMFGTKLRTLYPDDCGYYIKDFFAKDSKYEGMGTNESKIRKRISEYTDLLPSGSKPISLENIATSGKCNKIYEKELKGADPKTLIAKEFKSKHVSDDLRLYECWKKAFNKLTPANTAGQAEARN